MPGPDESWVRRKECERVARAVYAAVTDQSDHLERVVVGVPEGVAGADVEKWLAAFLLEMGLDFVDIQVVPGDEPVVTLVAVEFEPAFRG